MFGYVRVPLGLLPDEEVQRFRQMYCGLCHTLKQRHGFFAQFILNYDFTFLAMLLSEGEEQPYLQSRCVVSPLKKRCFAPDSPALTLAADQSVILAHWQLRDHIADSGFCKSFACRIVDLALKRAYHRASTARPTFDQATRIQLSRLHELEVERCPSIDRSADTFGTLLSSAAMEVDDTVQQRVLGQLLYHLGRWIYLIDAADDLAEDAQSGNYNPVALRFGLQNGQWDTSAKADFSLTLDHSVQFIATALALRPETAWTTLLEATVYKGLFAVGNAVLEGTFEKETKGLRKQKNVEEHP